LTHRYFIHLAYNGTNYHGWQLQHDLPTVQLVINNGLSLILREEINVVGCGRTDTGVHARNFYTHFDCSHKIDAQSLEQLTFKMNRFLDKDIAIYKIWEVNPKAHARFDAASRTYKYYVSNLKDPFKDDFTYYQYGDLNLEEMNLAAERLFDFIDFTSFSKLHTQTKTNDCKIYKANWEQEGHTLVFTIQADRFLRNMVRAVVGTLIEVGRGQLSINEFVQAIEAKNRSEAGYSVPAKALFLEDVVYPMEIINAKIS
jgi:tRNA pseudouridine38-40 synthase